MTQSQSSAEADMRLRINSEFIGGIIGCVLIVLIALAMGMAQPAG